MKTKPIGEKILIKRLESMGKTAGGIVLPDSAKEKPKEGTVIALGDGKLLNNGERSKFQVKKGDTVVFSSYAGTEITINNDEYLLMSEDDILAIID
ncbi:MAG: co-chaperone GroES [Planctomycetes bacterium]|nr:co-chaperone GroES [Planctomycetota bacterium]